MPNTIIFLSENLPNLLFGTLFVLAFVLLFADSIKKHYKIYYITFSILVIIELLSKWGPESFEFLWDIPLIRDVSHAASLGMPILIIVMYIGALDPKRPNVKKLFLIRKELSIIGGLVMLGHSLLRIPLIISSDKWWFISAVKFKKSMRADGLVLLARKFTYSAYYLGTIMFILLFILWITSFDKIHKKLGSKKWKKIQKMSYILYALMFLHSFLLNLGWSISSYHSLITKNDPEYLRYFIINLSAIAFTILLFGSYLILRVKKYKSKIKTK